MPLIVVSVEKAGGCVCKPPYIKNMSIILFLSFLKRLFMWMRNDDPNASEGKYIAVESGMSGTGDIQFNYRCSQIYDYSSGWCI